MQFLYKMAMGRCFLNFLLFVLTMFQVTLPCLKYRCLIFVDIFLTVKFDIFFELIKL